MLKYVFEALVLICFFPSNCGWLFHCYVTNFLGRLYPSLTMIGVSATLGYDYSAKFDLFLAFFFCKLISKPYYWAQDIPLYIKICRKLFC